MACVQGEGKGAGVPNPQTFLFILVQSDNMHSPLSFHLGRGFECHVSVMPRAKCLVLPLMNQPLSRREVQGWRKEVEEVGGRITR